MQSTAGETYEEGGAGGVSVVAVRPHLFLALEADRPVAGGARYGLTGVDEVVVGRGDERSARREKQDGRERLIVRVPGRWMSSTHARIVRVRGAWVLEDAGSRNGTHLRGERIERSTLADGDVFEAGHALFLLRDALPTPPQTATDLDTTSLQPMAPGLRTLGPVQASRIEDLVRIARAAAPILLLGETGTGKELLARAAHESSGRRGAFVAVNCGGLSPALVEGLLFGHVKGSFSGATRDAVGLVRAADGGTLFLDEVGDLPVAAQPALLRVIQQREVTPLGSTRAVPVDLRVVSATHRDLDALVAEGSFRRDLLMRLDGFRHELVPLRDRREDLGLLLADLVPRLAGTRASSVALTSAAARALLEHDWPGNVRELEHVLARGLALLSAGAIDAPQLALPPRAPATAGEGNGLGEADKRLRAELVNALTRHGGNVTEVAKAMGKARMQIQRWMRRFGLDPESFRRGRSGA